MLVAYAWLRVTVSVRRMRIRKRVTCLLSSVNHVTHFARKKALRALRYFVFAQLESRFLPIEPQSLPIGCGFLLVSLASLFCDQLRLWYAWHY